MKSNMTSFNTEGLSVVKRDLLAKLVTDVLFLQEIKNNCTLKDPPHEPFDIPWQPCPQEHHLCTRYDKHKRQLWSFCWWPGNFQSQDRQDDQHICQQASHCSIQVAPKTSLSMMVHTWSSTTPTVVIETPTKTENLSRNGLWIRTWPS